MDYKTIDGYAECEIIEKRSRFIGYIKNTDTSQQAADFISQIKSRHFDATHNCFAYIIKEENTARYSDDKEPTGTAGMPILQMIRNEGLENVCIVVTRYFGGTLLGAAGLVRAYSKAAGEAVKKSDICIMRECFLTCVVFDYSIYSKMQAMFIENECEILKSDFTHCVEVEVLIPVKKYEIILDEINNLSKGSAKTVKKGERYSKKLKK